jgi:hypothetical protein
MYINDSKEVQKMNLDIGPLNEHPRTMEERREGVRERLAMTLTYAVVGLGGLCVVLAVAFPDRAAKLSEITSVFLGPLIGVYGTVLGFYFSDKK